MGQLASKLLDDMLFCYVESGITLQGGIYPIVTCLSEAPMASYEHSYVLEATTTFPPRTSSLTALKCTINSFSRR